MDSISLNRQVTPEDRQKAIAALENNAGLLRQIKEAPSAQDVRTLVYASFTPPIDADISPIRLRTTVESAILVEALRIWNKEQSSAE